MLAGSHTGRARLPSVPVQDLSAYAWQSLAVVVAALALGLAAASDAYTAVALIGSAAAALALGVLFVYRRFGTLIATWLFFLLQPLLVAAVGEGSAAGRLVGVVDIPILLVIGSLGFFLAARHHATAVRWLSIAGGVVLVCGFASDIAAGAPLSASIVGAAYRLKFFLALGAGLAIQWTPTLATRARKVVIYAAIVVGITGIFDFVSGGALRGIFASPAPGFQPPRVGYAAAGGIFRNLAVLSTFMAIAFTVLLGMTWQGKAGRRVPQLLLVGLAALSTLRLKAIVSLPAATAALAATSKRVRSRLILVIALAALAVGALITLTQRDVVGEVVTEQVGNYTSETPRARQRLGTVSIEIARDSFPLGAGFGRFGSGPSIQAATYSPIYEQYGLSKHYGFRRGDPITFALDTSWPGLLGEVGVVGALAFATTVLALMLMLFRRTREEGAQADFASIGFGVMVVIVVASLGAGEFFRSFTMLTAVLFVIPGLWLAPGRSTHI